MQSRHHFCFWAVILALTLILLPVAGNAAGLKPAIALGGFHSLALKDDGSLWAWGHNNYGQLGLESNNDQYVPTQVGTGYVAVAAGGWHNLWLRADGSLWACGLNDYGQLGLGDTNDRDVPTKVMELKSEAGVITSTLNLLLLQD